MKDYRGKTDPFHELKVSGLEERQSTNISLNSDGSIAIRNYQSNLFQEDGLPSSSSELRKSETVQIMKTRAEKWDEIREETGIKDVQQAIGLIEKAQN